jgi:hypothetical protein
MSIALERRTLRPSMSSAGDSPARTSALPTPATRAGLAWTGLGADFGASSPELLANYDRASSSWRTVQPSLFEDSTACLQTLPTSGWMLAGQLFARPPWGPDIGENECSYVPTPQATDYKGGMVEPLRISQLRHWVSTLTGLSYPHPSAVEALMGFPTGWTELTPSGTP